MLNIVLLLTLNLLIAQHNSNEIQTYPALVNTVHNLFNYSKPAGNLICEGSGTIRGIDYIYTKFNVNKQLFYLSYDTNLCDIKVFPSIDGKHFIPITNKEISKDELLKRANKIKTLVMKKRKEHLSEPIIKEEESQFLGKVWHIVWNRISENSVKYQIDALDLLFSPNGIMYYFRMSFTTNILLNKNINPPPKELPQKAQTIAMKFLKGDFPFAEPKIKLKHEELEIRNLGFTVADGRHGLLSDTEDKGIIARQYVFELLEPIRNKNSDKLFYGISEVTIIYDAETHDLIGIDWK